jgi:hypothetical protein
MKKRTLIFRWIITVEAPDEMADEDIDDAVDADPECGSYSSKEDVKILNSETRYTAAVSH